MSTSILWLHGRQGATPGGLVMLALVFMFLLPPDLSPSVAVATASRKPPSIAAPHAASGKPSARAAPHAALAAPAVRRAQPHREVPQPAAATDQLAAAVGAARRTLRSAEAVNARHAPAIPNVSLITTATVSSTVKSVEGNVRSSPEIAKNVIGVVHRGDALVFLGVAGDWYLVKLGAHRSAQSQIPGGTGWVSHVIVHAPARQPPTITLDRVPAPASARASFSWAPSTNGRLIYQDGGALHFSVTKEQTRDGLAARIDAGPTGAPIKEVSFVATLQWSQGHAPGGVVFHAMLGDGRDLQLRVGPGEGYPWMDFLLDGGSHVARGRGFPYQEPVPIRMVWTGSEVLLSVNGVQRVHLPVTQPLTTVRFSLDADEGCIFHLKVDAFKVVFSGQ